MVSTLARRSFDRDVEGSINTSSPPSQDKVQYVERIYIGGERIRDIAFMSDGRIALLLERPPNVLFLSHSKKFCTEEFRQKRLVYALDCKAFGNDAAKTFSR